MMRLQRVLCGVVCLGAVMVFAAAAAWAQKSGGELDGDPLRSMLKRHDQAFADHDLDGVLALYSDLPSTTLMGTGAGEIWQGKEAIRNAYAHFFENFDKGANRRECPWVSITRGERLAWMMAVCDFVDAKAGKERKFTLHISAVLGKEGKSWRFVNQHFSLDRGEPK